jgi:hypothetical protein
VEGTNPQREFRGTDVFVLSPHLEETTPLMAPENSKVNQRLTGLENQIKDHTKEVANVQADLQRVDADLRSLGDRALTSWQVQTRVFLPLVITVLTAAVGLYFGLSTQASNRLPKDIEYGIYSSPALKDKFGGIDNHLTKIDVKLEDISRTLSLFAHTGAVSTAIIDATSVSGDQLPKSIPRLRNLLDFAKNSRTPLPSSTYKRASQKLFSHYIISTQPLKQQLWELLTYALGTRTSTDVALAPVAETDIDQARAAHNFFDGKVDLSQRTEWKDAIFKDAEISISKPENELILDGVRFIDCDFQSLSENDSNQKLLQNLLVASKPTFSVAINSFRVLTPRYSEPSPERKTDDTRLSLK